MNRHVPTKIATTRHNQPWITSELKRLTCRKKRSYNKQKDESKSSKDHQRYVKLKWSVEKECKKAHYEYMQDVASPEKGGGNRKFWSCVKNKKNDNTDVASLIAENGILHINSLKKADILNKQSSSVFNKDESSDNILDKGPSPHPSVNNFDITQKGVYKLRNNLNPY